MSKETLQKRQIANKCKQWHHFSEDCRKIMRPSATAPASGKESLGPSAAGGETLASGAFTPATWFTSSESGSVLMSVA
jgi:hypothetical protein